MAMRAVEASALAVVLTVGSPARADVDEMVTGAGASLVFPAFSPQDPTSFVVACWGLDGFAHYGITDTLSVGLAMSFASYVASSPAFRDPDAVLGAPLEGTLRFHGALYHPRILARYNLVHGYDVAPHASVSLGYLWATYRDPSLRDPHDAVLTEPRNFAEGSATASVALAVDWRLLDVLMVGVGVQYTHVLDGLLDSFVAIPITVAFFR